MRFACRLSIEAFRKAGEPIERRRLIAVEPPRPPSPPNRTTRCATTILSLFCPPPSARLHLAPVLLSLRAMIRKGVNRNGIIYGRARCFDMLCPIDNIPKVLTIFSEDFILRRVNLDFNSIRIFLRMSDVFLLHRYTFNIPF